MTEPGRCSPDSLASDGEWFWLDGGWERVVKSEWGHETELQARFRTICTLPEVDHDDPVTRETKVFLLAMFEAEDRGVAVWDDRLSDWRPRPRPSRHYHRRGRSDRRALTETELLEGFSKVKPTRQGYMALCPAHDDKSPSLSIRRGRSWWLLHCFAGCPIEKVVAAAGLRMAQLELAGS